MPRPDQRCILICRAAMALVALILSGCATVSEAPEPARTVALLTPHSALKDPILSGQFTALSSTVDPAEAERLASCAQATARALKIEYGIVGPALFHNFLINLGLKKRGLCYQWAEDMIVRLDALHLSTLELHWGVAHRKGLREHNCVVITARGQPFEQGIVLDCWRHAGRLYFGPVTGDHYPWTEDQWDWRRAAPARLHSAANGCEELLRQLARRDFSPRATIRDESSC